MKDKHIKEIKHNREKFHETICNTYKKFVVVYFPFILNTDSNCYHIISRVKCICFHSIYYSGHVGNPDILTEHCVALAFAGWHDNPCSVLRGVVCQQEPLSGKVYFISENMILYKNQWFMSMRNHLN